MKRLSREKPKVIRNVELSQYSLVSINFPANSQIISSSTVEIERSKSRVREASGNVRLFNYFNSYRGFHARSNR